MELIFSESFTVDPFPVDAGEAVAPGAGLLTAAGLSLPAAPEPCSFLALFTPDANRPRVPGTSRDLPMLSMLKKRFYVENSFLPPKILGGKFFVSRNHSMWKFLFTRQ